MGFDGIEFASLVHPSPALWFNLVSGGQEAAQILLRLVDEEAARSIKKELPYELVKCATLPRLSENDAPLSISIQGLVKGYAKGFDTESEESKKGVRSMWATGEKTRVKGGILQSLVIATCIALMSSR